MRHLFRGTAPVRRGTGWRWPKDISGVRGIPLRNTTTAPMFQRYWIKEDNGRMVLTEVGIVIARNLMQED